MKTATSHEPQAMGECATPDAPRPALHDWQGKQICITATLEPGKKIRVGNVELAYTGGALRLQFAGARDQIITISPRVGDLQKADFDCIMSMAAGAPLPHIIYKDGARKFAAVSSGSEHEEIDLDGPREPEAGGETPLVAVGQGDFQTDGNGRGLTEEERRALQCRR